MSPMLDGDIDDGSEFESKIIQGKWNDDEHTKFLDALRMYGKDWNKIQRHIGTRTIVNIRSHS